MILFVPWLPQEEHEPIQTRLRLFAGGSYEARLHLVGRARRRVGRFVDCRLRGPNHAGRRGELRHRHAQQHRPDRTEPGQFHNHADQNKEKRADQEGKFGVEIQNLLVRSRPSL